MVRRTRPIQPTPNWSRRKLLALLVAAGLGVVTVIVGLGLAVYYSLIVGPDPGRSVARDYSDGQPTPDVGGSAARPGPLTTKQFDEIRLPAPTSLGPIGVSSGYPRTPEGALAQLAAIDQMVLQSASVTTAQDVIREWAVPGGPTPESWSGVHAVAALLGSAGVTGAGDSALTVSASPELGVIQREGGLLVVCVDFVVTATMTKTASIAAADCQRMVWVDGRWMIGAGPEPAQAPSVWPGTDAALQAGYKVLRDG